MTATAARGHQVRQRLLAAAAELIPEAGWSAVSTRILAQRAGVTPSVVHYHFPSLQAVLQEAALGVMRQALAELDALVDGSAEPDDLIDAALAVTRPYTDSAPTTLLFVEAYLAAVRNESFGAEVAGLLARSRARLAARLTAAGLEDADGAAAVVFAALDGLALQQGLGVGAGPSGVAAALRRVVGGQGQRR